MGRTRLLTSNQLAHVLGSVLNLVLHRVDGEAELLLEVVRVLPRVAAVVVGFAVGVAFGDGVVVGSGVQWRDQGVGGGVVVVVRRHSVCW